MKKATTLRNKSNFLSSLTDDQLKQGYCKMDILSPNGNVDESVWVWLSKRNKAKYVRGDCFESVTATLVNYPVSYLGILEYGSEVKMQLRGTARGVLDNNWISNILIEIEKEANGGIK